MSPRPETLPPFCNPKGHNEPDSQEHWGALLGHLSGGVRSNVEIQGLGLQRLGQRLENKVRHLECVSGIAVIGASVLCLPDSTCKVARPRLC